MKSVIVTGAGAGLGLSICRRFAAGGFRVGVLDVNAALAEQAASGLPNAVPLQADVTDIDSIRAAMTQFGGELDVLVNNAGIVRFGPLVEQTAESFRATVAVNLLGSFNCALVAAQAMLPRGAGNIVNITSINAITPGPNAGAYPATKAAVAALTMQMANEWGPAGLRINAVAPGFIDGGMSTPVYANPEVRRLRGGAVPSRRLGLPEEVAEAVWFLSSDAAAYINGHQLVVDGGVVHSLLSQLPRA